MLNRSGTLSIRRKIKAKSLPYIIIFLLLAGSVMAATILLVSYFLRLSNQLESENLLIDNARSVRNLCRSKRDIGLSYENIKEIENAVVKKNSWGVLDMIQFKVWNQKDTLKETLFLGEKGDRDISLYIAKSSKKLKLGGNILIEGDAYLPMGTYDELNIFQKINSIKFRGKINESLELLPNIRKFFIERKFKTISIEGGKTECYNSFFSETKKIIVDNGVLEGIKLKGNIIVESPKKLTIKKGVELSNVIIIAPEVTIEDGFVGEIQVLASKKIKLGVNVKLNFPSVLYLNSNEEGVIRIEEKSTVMGAVIGFTSNGSCDIDIKEKTKIVGDLYCKGSLLFKGIMHGSMQVNEFYYNTSESKYKNASYNLQIFKLPSFAPQITIFNDKKASSQILKCIK